MKKIIIFSLLFIISWGLLFSQGVKAITTDVPIPLNYCAYSSGQTVFIQWNYSCPSLYSCSIEIEEYKGSSWTNIATLSAASSPKTFSGQSYGSHQYRMRAKLVYLLTTMYSSYTANFYAYVLPVPTGLAVSVNPDLFLSEGNPYLTLKWNPLAITATGVWVYRRNPGFDIPNLIAKLPGSATSYDDTTVNYNTTYEYTITAVRKDDTSIHDDFSAPTPLVPKLTLPAPPTNFKANAIDKTIYMSWSHTRDCDGYKI